MILYLDPFRLMPPTDVFEVSSEAAYVEARRQMLAYRRGTLKQVPTFVVYQHPYLAWFDDLPEGERISVSPRSRLSERYPAITLPADLNDADVMALNLLTAGVEPTVSALCTHYFGTLLNKVDTNPATLLALAQFVMHQSAVMQKRYPTQLWQERLAVLPTMLAPLRDADKVFCEALAEGIYMAGIPVLLTDWEHSHAVPFRTQYGLKMGDLLLLMRWSKRLFPDDPGLETILKKRLHEHLKGGGNAPNTVLPGVYRAEVEVLMDLTPKLTADQRQQLEEKYADLLTPELHQRLQTLVPPTLDPAPDFSGLPLHQQAEAWQQWAVKSFIPYKFWLDTLPNPAPAQVELVELLATDYGDWLFANYAALLAQNSVLTNYGVRQQVLEALTGNSRVIWLIIDGFPAAFVPLLERQLRVHGLIRQTKQYALAPLPTITEVGIPVLVNGLTPDSSAFTTDRREALKRAFPGCTTTFAAVVAQFQEALDSDADLCCLHWQEIDKTLHRDDNEFDNPTARLEQIGELLNERLGKLAAVINRQTDRPTKLIISTDHGATKCLRNGINVKNDKITAAAAANPRERSVKLESKLLSVHIDEKETYHLTAEITRNPVAYVAARGYRYFGVNDRGYRHGGLTPEETIVPVLVAEMAQFAVEPLQLTYYGGMDGLPQGKALKDFKIQVQNANAFAVEVVTLLIKEDTNGQFDLPISIGPNDSVVLIGTIKIAQKYKAQNGQLPLAVTITYQANAENFTELSRLVVPIQTNELDDFFDF